MEVYTIGHSTRTLDVFVRMLHAHEVKHVADVRAFPASRRYPHFGQRRLSEALPSAGIAYTHLPLLGGRRQASPRTPSGWRNDSFAAYADYMETPDFERGLSELIGISREHPTAMMCAEAVPWRCHRWLVSDALLARGVHVEHILGMGKRRAHSLTEWARLDGEKVVYPLQAQVSSGND